MAHVKLMNICKRYDNGFEAVKNADIEIKDKEFVVLVGPSGCGKSTTLRMIAGLEEVTSGELYIGDTLANELPAKDRDIAMVFRNYALYPHMTVEQNMGFGLKLRKVPKDDIKRKVSDVSKMLQLDSLLARKPKALSGGQRQRVALGRAIVRNPKVFLMDEPLSNLDAKLRTEMRSVITKLHKELEATFIYVTHDQVEAMTMGDRIVIMNEGLVQQFDTPQNLYHNPKNMFVAGFLGSPQMNFLNCTFTKLNQEYYGTSENDSFTIKIPHEKGIVLEEKGYLGKEIVIGIRPENITHQMNSSEKSSDNLKARVVLREIMGPEAYVYLKLGRQQLIARFEEKMNVNIEDIIDLSFDMNKLYIFDKEAEDNVFYTN